MTDKTPYTMPDSPRRSGLSMALAIASLGVCASTAIAILATRQRFSQMFEEFGMKMPAIAHVAVSPLLPAILGFAILVGVCNLFVFRQRASFNVISFAVLLVSGVSLAIYAAGVYAPLMSLVDSLSR